MFVKVATDEFSSRNNSPVRKKIALPSTNLYFFVIIYIITTINKTYKTFIRIIKLHH